MSIRNAMAVACGALLCLSGLSARAQDGDTPEDKTAQTCCMSGCAKHEGKMKCSLTGQVMDTCCCTQKEGKLHCTLADKDVETCCCSPMEDEHDAMTDTTDKTDKTDKTDTTDNTHKMDPARCHGHMPAKE